MLFYFGDHFKHIKSEILTLKQKFRREKLFCQFWYETLLILKHYMNFPFNTCFLSWTFFIVKFNLIIGNQFAVYF